MPASRRSWIVPGILVVLLVALLGTSAVIWSHHGRDTDPGMLVSAKLEANNFFSLDYRHADKDVDRVLALATGKFKNDYSARRQQVVDGVVKKKLVVTAAIPQDGAAVELVNGSHGQVLVAVDVTTTTADGASTLNRYRARVFLTRQGGHWLVSDLNQVG